MNVELSATDKEGKIFSLPPLRRCDHCLEYFLSEEQNVQNTYKLYKISESVSCKFCLILTSTVLFSQTIASKKTGHIASNWSICIHCLGK